MSDAAISLFCGYVLGIVTAFFVIFSFGEYTQLYKQGQIDALSGKVAFELKKQEDNTVIWERK
jgi:small basic protein